VAWGAGPAPPPPATTEKICHETNLVSVLEALNATSLAKPNPFGVSLRRISERLYLEVVCDD
jgi:hypothetical protein